MNDALQELVDHALKLPTNNQMNNKLVTLANVLNISINDLAHHIH